MFVRALRGACGVIRYFDIDTRGNIRCTMNDDYEAPLRNQKEILSGSAYTWRECQMVLCPPADGVFMVWKPTPQP